MKKIRFLPLIFLLAAFLQAEASIVNVTVSGYVNSLNPSSPAVPNHPVFVTAFPDSINTFTAVTDTVLTNNNGYYIVTLQVPFIPGTASPMVAGTYDCMNLLHQQFLTYTGDSSALIANFSICTDSITPTLCDNYIFVNGMQGLTVAFQGGLYNPQTADYFWDFGDGITGTGTNISHIFPATGTYLVSLTTTTNTGCTDLSTLSIMVGDSINPSLCDNYILLQGIQGLTATFQGELYNQQTADYTWNFGDGTTGTGALISHSFPAAGYYPVQLATITNAGCTDTSYYYVYLTDTINPLPCENYVIVETIAGLTVTLNGGMVNQQTATYSWSLGDGTSASGQTVTHTYLNPGTYSVILNTITSDSCTDQSTFPVTVFDSIPSGCWNYFYTSPGNDLFQIHFDAITSNSYPTDYQWNFDDPASGVHNTSTLQNPDHTFTAVGTYLVTLTTTDSANCTSVYTAPVTISMFGTYTLYGQVFAGNQAIAESKVVLYGTDSLGIINLVAEAYPDSAYTYKFMNIPSGMYYLLAIPEPGTIYALEYLPTYFGDELLWVNAIPIMLGQPANPYNINLIDYDSISGGNGIINGQLINGGKSLSVGQQEILIFDVNNIAVKYMLSQPDGTFNFSELPYGTYSVYPEITGITTVPVTVSLDAANSTASVIMTINGQTITGIRERTQLINTIAPNPAKDVLFVQLKPGSGDIASYRISDIAGRILIDEKLPAQPAGNLITVNVSSLLNGMYMVQVNNQKGESSAARFIKQN